MNDGALNETQEAVVRFLKSRTSGASVLNVMEHCYLSRPAAWKALEKLNSLGIVGKSHQVGKSHRGTKAWYTFVRDL